MGAKAEQRCPQCGSPVSRSDYQCPGCELVLESVAAAPARDRREVSVVRAMLERPRGKSDGEGVRGFARPPSGVITDPGRARVPLDRVLRVSAPLRLNSLDLHPYEAWVVSLVDGRITGEQLGRKLDLAPRELHGLLHGLLTRGAISLDAAVEHTEITEPVRVRPPRDEATQLLDRDALFEGGLSAEPSPKQPPPPRPRSGARAPLSRPASRALPAAADPQLHEPTQPRAPEPRAPEPRPPAPSRPRSGAAPAARPPSRVLNPARPPSRPAEPARQVQGIEDLDPHGALQVALQMEQSGRLEEAVGYLERAIARSPDAAPLYNRLAVILMRDFEDFGRAEQLLMEALHLAPRHPVFTRNLATVKQRQQEARRNRQR